MRIYPIKIKKDNSELIEDKIGIDAEDLFNLINELELTNFNVLENWFNIRNQIIEILSSSQPDDLPPPIPPSEVKK